MKRQLLLEQLFQRIQPTIFKNLTIAVDGIDAAGKTIFADSLAEFLLSRTEKDVVRATVDSWINPPGIRYAAGRESAEGYYRNSFDLPAVKRYVEEQIEQDPGNRLLVFDGVFAFTHELNALWDYRILLAIPFELSIQRGLARDTGKGIPEPALCRLYERRYIGGQKLYLSEVRPETLADVIVDNRVPGNPNLIDSGQYLKMMLGDIK